MTGVPLELVVFSGIPGAGKSTFYRERFAATHVHVSKDLMPNARRRDEKQMRQIVAALAAGRSVVVDNTHPRAADRAPLVALGRRHGARVVSYHFEADVQTGLARNAGRAGKARVPPVAIFTAAKHLALPAAAEGFDQRYRVTARDGAFAVEEVTG